MVLFVSFWDVCFPVDPLLLFEIHFLIIPKRCLGRLEQDLFVLFIEFNRLLPLPFLFVELEAVFL